MAKILFQKSDMKKEDLIEFLTFLEEEGLMTYEDKEEIFIKKNVERLKTLAYLCIEHIKKKLENDELNKYKYNKLRKMMSSLMSSDTKPKLAVKKRDLLSEGESLEKIVGD